MKIFPAIDLKNGRCVRLLKGDFNQVTEYNSDPIEQAIIFKSKKLNYLIAGDKPTKRKLENAKNLKIRILNQNEWLKMLNKSG